MECISRYPTNLKHHNSVASATLAYAASYTLNMLPFQPQLLPLLLSAMRSSCLLLACTDLYGS